MKIKGTAAFQDAVAETQQLVHGRDYPDAARLPLGLEALAWGLYHRVPSQRAHCWQVQYGPYPFGKGGCIPLCLIAEVRG